MQKLMRRSHAAGSQLHPISEKRSYIGHLKYMPMKPPAAAWLEYAEEDGAAASELMENHETIAAYHAHQAAEKGLKALQIHRSGEHERTHDLVRLYHRLDVPPEYRSLLEDLNPADTAARYPDADEVHLDEPDETLEQVGELLTWIHAQLNE